ncbi:hypothetical protein JMF89_13535 [Clostridiaceae bacterium UIB06]|nr:hypothetical protein [Clostridiaceae bacterium UIB06]
MDEYNIFVRINYNTMENREKVTVGRTKVNNGKVSSSRYLIGGGVYNKNGGSVVFTAKSLEEIKQITINKPDMSMNYNVAVIPKGI